MKTKVSLAALNTKLKSMKKSSISSNELDYMSKINSFEELTSFLSQFPNFQGIAKVNSSNNNRELIEQRLMLSIYKDISKIYYFSTIKERNFLRIFIEKFEVNAIKNMLHKLMGMSQNDFRNNILPDEVNFFLKYGSINLNELYNQTTPLGLISKLENTKYYNVLKPLIDIKNFTAYECDILLDTFHYQNILKIAQRSLSKSDYKIFRLKYGELIDITNIYWIYRGKKYYNMDDISLSLIVIPIYTKITKAKVEELIKANYNDFIRLLSTTYYHKYKIEDFGDNISFDELIYQIIYKSCANDNSYVPIVTTYLYNRQLEMNNIITFIEKINYHTN